MDNKGHYYGSNENNIWGVSAQSADLFVFDPWHRLNFSVLPKYVCWDLVSNVMMSHHTEWNQWPYKIGSWETLTPSTMWSNKGKKNIYELGSSNLLVPSFWTPSLQNYKKYISYVVYEPLSPWSSVIAVETKTSSLSYLSWCSYSGLANLYSSCLPS